VLIELTPDVPLPGGMIKGDTIGRGVQWAAVGFNMTPEITAKLTIQSPDAASAAALHDAATKLLGAAKGAVTQLIQEEPKVKDMLGNIDALAAAVTPKLSGDRLTLSLDADAGMKFTGLLAPAIAKSGVQAQRGRSASNMLMILQACLLYANENKGQFPADFDTLLKTQDITKAVFRNPTMPWKEIGYVYLRPVEGAFAPAEQVILYEAHELEKLKPTDGLNVGFGDGHVDFIQKEQFQRMLAQSIDRNEQAANKRANEKKQ
jgi:prepilin-type processing-associated H-X9-DG protein